MIGKANLSREEEGNPFQTGSEYSGNAGVDLKYGLSSSLTLDLTANPDFGQVEVDPAVINLSAGESYYSEKRPFFVEGSHIFGFGREVLLTESVRIGVTLLSFTAGESGDRRKEA